jgi:hypothetical protein
MKTSMSRPTTLRKPTVEQFESRLLLSGSFPDAAAVAMAYDGAGALHVAYQNAGGDSALRYATRAVDGVWSAPATVDPTVAAGSHLSIAVNAGGTPGIAYYDPTAGDLKYASPSGTEWQLAVVDFKGDVGRHPALAFDKLDRPLISSYSATKQDLKLATFNGRRWRNVVVDAKKDVGRYSSIDVNPVDGTWAIAYESTSTGQAKIRSRRDKKAVLASWPLGGELSAAPAVAFDGAGNPGVTFAAPGSDTLVLYRPTQVRKKRVWSGTPVSTGAAPAAQTLLGFTADNLPLVVYPSASNDVYLASQGPGGWSSASFGAGSAFAFDAPRQAVAVMNLGVLNEFSPALLAPAALTATPTGPAAVELTWSPVAGATGYVVQRAQAGSSSATIASVGSAVTALVDSSAVEGDVYTYRVYAVDSVFTSLTAATATATLPLLPATGLAAAAGAGGIVLQWVDHSSHETGYAIERSADGATWGALTTVGANATTYTDLTASEGTPFSYRVRPVKGAATSTGITVGPFSVSVFAPSGFAAAAAPGSAGQSQINLTWTDASSVETGYRIERSPDGSAWSLLHTTAANVTQYSDTGLSAGATYHYRVRANASSDASAYVAASAITATSGAPQFLLTPSALAELRAKASATSGPAAAQWAAFRAMLDNELGKVTAPSYQADQVMWASDFALGYQALKNTDPVTASAYADKAIAMLLSGIRDNARNATGTRMFLGRGDGATTTFPVPHTTISASTVRVWTPTVNVRTIVKGAANGQDTGETYMDWLKVSLTSDGPAAYTKGVDWRINPDYRDDKLDWSLPGAEPAPGTTYYVTQASSSGIGQASGWTFNGSAITFASAPAANRVVYVEYQYGTPSGGASTLGYQQTSDGRGGFNNSMIDVGYTSRFLKHAPIALDWLWDYQGLSSSVRSEAIAMFVRWSDQFRDNAYQANSPASNYGAGHYAYRTAVAIALQGRSPEAARLASEVQTYRQNRVLPIFQPATGGKGSMKGGFWAEGWNYGALAIRNIITSGFAFESAGWAPGGATAERDWAGEVIHTLLSQQPTQATIYDGGDGYAYPLPFPDKDLLTDLASAASDPAMKSYANWTLQNYPGSTKSNWEQVMYRTPNAPAAFWGSALPLHQVSTGTGTAVARKDWNYNSTWLSFHSGNLVEAEHQSNDQGGIQINRGGDALLVNVAAVTGDQTYQNKSTYGNLVVIDDGGAGEQTYRYAQGGWYGNPGVTMPHFDGAADYVYMQGNYRAAYTHHYGEPGAPNPASELTRSVFYVRSADYVIVYDRATTTQAGYLKQLRWHLTGTATVAGDAWTITTGASKLFGKTYSSQALTTSTQTVTQNGVAFRQITTNNAAPTASVGYVTALQTAASATAAMDTSSRVASGDGKVEGVQIGAYAVLFGTHGAVAGGTSYPVTAAAGQTLTHYVSDLVPGATYTLTGANQASATANAQGVLTFDSSGTGAAQTVTLVPS